MFPAISTFELVFHLTVDQAELLRPFAETEYGWKTFSRHCQQSFQEFSHGAAVLDLERTRQFLQLIGRQFLNDPEIGKMVDQELYERFDADGSGDLNFSQTFRCFKFLVTNSLRDAGALEAMHVETQGIEVAGYTKIKKLEQG